MILYIVFSLGGLDDHLEECQESLTLAIEVFVFHSLLSKRSVIPVGTLQRFSQSLTTDSSSCPSQALKCRS